MLASNPRFSSPEGAPFCLKQIHNPPVMFDKISKSLSQNVGTIAVIHEDSDKIEWFLDRL
ncbi:hypothetical protein LEP1GSC133_1318 [Leptospira borgpetersenii serovar Pomona str. 200901868]|uniref:Uncharacterized protein n=1 Tax=Leptospira borgpetersenii serovar Pomona str. 200901868 TaxID=1192866 RepID=M6WHK8_LEPBO|nr:hypothetical protein LEP1GSC133_1318 [Leptospira borgpetersenii serovar Pomona str. 200901868]